MRYLLIALLLTSCGLNPEYVKRKSDEKMARIDKACSDMGYAQGSKELADCKMTLYRDEKGYGQPQTPYTPRTTNCVTQNGVTNCHKI
jgi:hypothetical protein